AGGLSRLPVRYGGLCAGAPLGLRRTRHIQVFGKPSGCGAMIWPEQRRCRFGSQRITEKRDLSGRDAIGSWVITPKNQGLTQQTQDFAWIGHTTQGAVYRPLMTFT
ncbi:MAG: hypothetical protein ABJP66_12170, partial [Hyphomicrobiales bacterium]